MAKLAYADGSNPSWGNPVVGSNPTSATSLSVVGQAVVVLRESHKLLPRGHEGSTPSPASSFSECGPEAGHLLWEQVIAGVRLPPLRPAFALYRGWSWGIPPGAGLPVFAPRPTSPSGPRAGL